MPIPHHGRPSVTIVGGGLAGLAAAQALALEGLAVTILESRGRLGGRASSFHDVSSGQLIDTCQHVSMGCCTNFEHFCRTIGIRRFLQDQPFLFFMTPDRKLSRFRADTWPAPFHLARSFLSAHFLSLHDKTRIALGLARLTRVAEDADGPFLNWLKQQGQTDQAISRFWGLVLTSALNESIDRVGLRYARKVFLDGFWRHRRGFVLQMPTVPLGRLYGEEMQEWFEQHEVSIRLNSAVRSLAAENHSIRHIELRNSEQLLSDWYILAIPFEKLSGVLPDAWAGMIPFSQLGRLESSPITSVHVWYDRPVLQLPHVILVDCLGQWVFNRGQTATGEHYLQVVVSAARALRESGHQEAQQQIGQELAKLFPEATTARLVRSRPVTEHAATFSAVPHVDDIRPGPETPIGNLLLAGDWTATGWPATMEGAVRSGYRAAEALLRRLGRYVRMVRPDLQ